VPLGAHLAIPGAIISDKKYLPIPAQAALADRVAVLIGTSKQAPTKMSGGNDGNWVRLTVCEFAEEIGLYTQPRLCIRNQTSVP
jgi:hypothetical protein